MVLESLPENQRHDEEPGNTATFVMETVCVTFFTIEIIIRFIATESCEEWASSFFTCDRAVMFMGVCFRVCLAFLHI